MYQILVIEVGLSPEYVLDRMQMYEAEALLEKMPYKHRDSWEQARMIMYVIAQSNSRKKISPAEIIHFPWEDTNEKEDPIAEPTEEEMEALREKMKQYIKEKDSSCPQI